MRYFVILTSLFFCTLIANADETNFIKKLVSSADENGNPYIVISQDNGWSGYVEKIDGNENIYGDMILERGNIKLRTPVGVEGSTVPEVISIDEVTLCNKNYVVGSIQYYFYFDFPSFYYERHVTSLDTGEFIGSLGDEESSEAGGLVPVWVSKAVSQIVNCVE